MNYAKNKQSELAKCGLPSAQAAFDSTIIKGRQVKCSFLLLPR